MIVVEYQRIELDYCTDCSGVWFDAGELELLLESMNREGAGLSLDNVLTSPEASSAEKKRKCPICRQRMKKATVGHAPEVLIDACPRGDGLWFDKGEVSQVVTQAAAKPSGTPDAQGRVLAFLGDVFKAGG
jgi:Zn-finger nucleic acid-binding protein